MSTAHQNAVSVIISLDCQKIHYRNLVISLTYLFFLFLGETATFVGTLRLNLIFTNDLENTNSPAFQALARATRLDLINRFCTPARTGCSLTVINIRRGSSVIDYKVTLDGKASDLEKEMIAVSNSLPKRIANGEVLDKSIRKGKGNRKNI